MKANWHTTPHITATCAISRRADALLEACAGIPTAALEAGAIGHLWLRCYDLIDLAEEKYPPGIDPGAYRAHVVAQARKLLAILKD